MEERSIREIIREERKKLSGMTWGQRLGYIWDYYKPLMVAVLVIIVIISIGVTIYQNMQINYIVQVYMTNCNSLEMDVDQIAADFGEYIGGLEKHDQVTVDTSVLLDSESLSEAAMAGQMKMMALSAAGDIDVVLFDEANFERYCESGALEDLESLLDQEQLAAWSDLLVPGTNSETGEEGVYALQLQNAPLLVEQNAYGGGPVYGAVMVSSVRKDMGVAFLQFLLEE